MIRTGVIIQARIGSSRLPGKVMMPLSTMTVLAHVIERCRAIAGIDAVCCAIPDGLADNVVASEAWRAGAQVFRGAEADVLERYWRAAVWLRLDVVMRVTADCPLLDPMVCADVLALRQATDADYACNNQPPSWPHGLDCEAFTFAALDRVARHASRPWQREHVTPWLRADKATTRANLPMPGKAANHHHWALDTGRDLEFLREVTWRLPEGRAGWDHRAVLAVVAAEPALFAINAGQDRWEGRKCSIEAGS
jgi:spore coat polysaccharide biosynthesis protein SpsF